MTALAAIRISETSRRQPAADDGVYAPLGLRDDPFPRDPLGGAWVDLPSQVAALAPVRSFLDDEVTGIAIAGGHAGSGKTRLLHHLAGRQHNRLTGIVADGGQRRSDAQLLRATIVALGGKPIGRAGLELVSEARTLLDARREDAGMPVLFIDNAALTGSQLEIVRSLLAPADGETRVQIVLFGPPELEDRIARRRSLARFLRETISLEPLGFDETRLLLDARIAAVRGNRHVEPFTPAALDTLWQETGGNAGAVTNLAHRCLREAIATGATQVEAGLVSRVAETPDEDPVRATAPEGPIQTRLTLPGLDERATPSRRRGRQR
jgi:type II secretory pathway predicted ATPase ExeA